MNIHKIKLEGYHPCLCHDTPLILGTVGSYGNESLQVDLGEYWKNLTIKVIFHPCKVTCLLPPNGILNIPWEATDKPLKLDEGRIVFQGFDEEKLINSTDIVYSVMGHSSTAGREERSYTPSVVESLLKQMESDKADIMVAAQQTEYAMTTAVHNAQVAQKAIKIVSAACRGAEEAQAQAVASEKVIVNNVAVVTKMMEQVQSVEIQATSNIKKALDKSIASIQNAVETAIAHLEDAESVALKNIACAAPSLPAISTKDIGQAITVSTDAATFDLTGPYAPITSAIVPTVKGNPVVCKNSIAWRLQGLKIYGKSTQSAIPSLENPAPIASAGESGKIVLNISDNDYNTQSFTISTPNGLLGIPVGSAGNYTDSNGQQWICDEIDFKNHIYIKRIGCSRLDSRCKWIVNEPWNNQFYNTFFAYTFEISRELRKDYTPLSNCFNNVINLSNWRTQLYNGMEAILFESSSSAVYIAVRDENLETQDLTGFQKWLDQNQIYIIYILSNPVEITISDEDMARYNSLTTYNSTTTISTSEDICGVQVYYLADSSKIIDAMNDRLDYLEGSQE